MKTRLILVRHGYSQSNRSGYFTGQTDVPLTEIGYIQSKRAAEYLMRENIDKIYSSTLSRAYNTGLAIAEAQGLELTPEPALCEIYGGKWEGQSFKDLANISAEEYNNWINDFYRCKCPDGESVKAFIGRILSAVTKIAEENEGKCVCLATHATPVRIITCCALGLDPQRIQEVPWSANASINIVEYKNGKFSFVARDITEHLKGMETNLPANV